jgi:hypothetical protein
MLNLIKTALILNISNLEPYTALILNISNLEPYTALILGQTARQTSFSQKQLSICNILKTNSYSAQKPTYSSAKEHF